MDRNKKYSAAHNRLQSILNQYSPEMDDPDGEKFTSSLMEKLDKVSIEKEIPAEKVVFKPAFSIAALILILIGAALFFFQQQDPEEIFAEKEVVPESVYSAKIDEPVGIVLEYESDIDVEYVEVCFHLERGVRFHSDNEEISEMDKFVWKGSLSKGMNEIPFVVNIIEKGNWEITTTARFDGFVHRHTISFDATGDRAIVKILRHKPEKIGT
jgi:hypothetical protein